MYAKHLASILLINLVVSAYSYRISPCGFIYNLEEYNNARTLPKPVWHDLLHLIPKVTNILDMPQLNILTDFKYEENWIPSVTALERYEGFRMPYRILKLIIPEAFKSLEIFAFAIQVNLDNLKEDNEDEESGNIALLNKLMRKNAQMICEADLLMRKFNVHFESISNDSEQYTIPSDWLESARSSHKTHRILRQNEVLFKYKTFLTKLHRILSE